MTDKEINRERYRGAAFIVALLYFSEIIKYIIPPHEGLSLLKAYSTPLIILFIISDFGTKFRLVPLIIFVVPFILPYLFK